MPSTFRDFSSYPQAAVYYNSWRGFVAERLVRSDVVVLVHELLQCRLQFVKVAAEDPEVEELPDDGGAEGFDLSVELG